MEEKKKFKLGLLPKLIIAIIIGILFGQFLPEGFCRFVVTLSSFFSQFLSFIIPLMILAYVTMGIANLKSGAGKLLLITVAIAYCSTLIAGSASFFVADTLFPHFMSADALDKIAAYDYDCILLDIMLPDGSGLRILEELRRQRKPAGVIIISARDSLDDKVEGLELGADDYLPKPFHLAELSARIRSVVRRHQRDGQQSLDVGNVRLYPDSRRVEVAGCEVELLRKEYDILYYFMSRPNHMVDKATLAEAVWGDHIDQADNFDFVYAQMKNLRRRLHDAQADIEIRAVYGFGYKLVAP